jgi:hypothetical protein
VTVCFAAVQVSNQALADEKTRTDVLLARQYNLISLMAQQGMFGNSSGCGASALHEKTLGAWPAAVAMLVNAACTPALSPSYCCSCCCC